MKKNQNTRRNFLKTVGLAGTTLALNPISVIADENIKELEKPAENTNELQVDKFTLNILQTTDVHCQVYPHDELFWENNKAVFRQTGGYAQMATYFKQERSKNKNTFIIDTGDMFQGSQLSYKTTGKAFVPILNKLDYDLYLPGNWEVVYYKKAMQQLLGALNAPKVCANMYHDAGNGQKGELIFPPYYIWNINGVKIGFLGYTDHLVPLRQSPNYSKGIVYTKPEENLAHYVSVLKNDEQCAFVAVVAHLGLSQQIHLANLPECEGVDYILGGDTHERVRKPIQCKYAKVVEPGAFGSFVGKLELTMENGKVVKDSYELVELDAKKYKADKEMDALIHKQEQPFLKDLNEVIGYSTIPLYRYFVIENTIDTMLINALQWQLPEVDVVLSNGFRFCPPRSTKDKTGNIPVTKSFIFDMIPVDSNLRTAKIVGYKIKEWLEKELNNVFSDKAVERFGGWLVKFGGMKVEFKAFGEKGKRVQKVMIKGEVLQEDKVYTVAACQRDGDPDDMLCRIKGVFAAQNKPITLHKMMENYLRANSPVTPTPLKNAIALDAPENLLTQVTGVDYQFT
ncbi:MAG: 5'-nucleotidase C-terminal domain-containing protein [Thermonemataceae bacterium]|nr:5'-nucleotidase C-terminal domain-containing protein [Thermonemataceae bacterium]